MLPSNSYNSQSNTLTIRTKESEIENNKNELLERKRYVPQFEYQPFAIFFIVLLLLVDDGCLFLLIFTSLVSFKSGMSMDFSVVVEEKKKRKKNRKTEIQTFIIKRETSFRRLWHYDLVRALLWFIYAKRSKNRNVRS